MSHEPANGIKVLLLALCAVTVTLASAPANSQGFLDRARSLLGGDDAADSSEPAQASNLTEAQIGAGLKEALRTGVEQVVGQLGSAGGFSADPLVHIALPESLGRVASALERIGLSSQMEELELRLNEAAEAAVPRARNLFVSAIESLTLEDAIEIYRGPDDAATQYFRQAMSEPLAAEMRPVVEQSLEDVGAARTFENVMDRYNALPFVPSVDLDMTSYVVEKGLEGVFYYLAQEESAIRQDPLKRTSELLQRVFGN